MFFLWGLDETSDKIALVIEIIEEFELPKNLGNYEILRLTCGPKAPLFGVLGGFLSCFLLFISSASSAEFKDEIERDFALRSIGQLQVTNLRGSITVIGWAQDRIRIKAHRRAVAESEADAKKLLSNIDFRYRTLGNDIELSAEYGKGLEIQDRLREKETPRTSMDIVVRAPANLKLQVWASEGSVSVKSWNSSVEVRTGKGPIRIEEIKATDVSLLCPSCAIHAEDVAAALRCMGGSGNISLIRIQGPQVYVESTSGSLSLTKISSKEQLYVSKTGAISGQDLKGRIEFSNQRGAVDLTEAAGFVSGHTESSNILVKMRDWKFVDKALLESMRGSISLFLPPNFAGEVDLWSVQGKTQVAFPVRPLKKRDIYGPEPPGHILGIIGEGEREQLKLFSQEGDVQLFRLD